MFQKKHVKIEVKWHARHATADLLSKSVRVIRLRRSGRVASCCARIMRRARQIDALVTLPLLVHGELLGVFLTNWNPGSIFLLTKQSSVSGQPQIWIRGTNQINKCYKRFLENKLRVWYLNIAFEKYLKRGCWRLTMVPSQPKKLTILNSSSLGASGKSSTVCTAARFAPTRRSSGGASSFLKAMGKCDIFCDI